MSNKIFDTPVTDVYVHYINRIGRKNRSEAELLEAITWLTGMEVKEIKAHLNAVRWRRFSDPTYKATIHVIN